MPLLFRAMLNDGGKPVVAPNAKSLGARVKTANAPGDIPVQLDGTVFPGTGGISVAPAWRMLPIHRIPRRLADKVPGAAGRLKDMASNQDMACWRLGSGPFAAEAVTADLDFRPDPRDPDKHGFIEPALSMQFADYQAALAATRDQWIIDEG